MKLAMYRFKYANRRCYARIFANQALRDYGKWLKDIGVEVIIPVPMFKKKIRSRGYNQAAVFARAMSQVTGLSVDDRAVRRIVDTKPMKELNNMQRRTNLKEAFRLSAKSLPYTKVLVVDDIYTTGATMDQVAAVLKAGGVSEVYGLCVCTGDKERE